MIGSAIIRGESWKLSFGPETVFGTDPGTDYLETVFGVVQTGTMPDPDMEWEPIWALGSASARNFYTMYRGKKSLNGSIGDIWILDGAPALYLPIGTVATVGSDKALGGGSTLNGGTAIGATSAVLTDATDYTTGDYIQIDTTTLAEVRKITNVVTNTLTLDFPLQYAHTTGATCNEVQSTYTHTISEASTLLSFTMQHEMFDSTNTSQLIRRYSGGKVGRASFAATEGEQLRVSLDDMMFCSYKADGGAGVATASLTYPTTQPMIFSYGALTLWGTEFARLKNFNIDLSNNLEPKYYLTDDATAYLPYELREGKREYRIRATIDITDSTLFDEMVKYGVNHGAAVDGLFKGFDMSMVFTRDTGDTITFTLPPSSATAAGDGQGCFIKSAPHNIVADAQVSVDLEIIARSMKVVVVDSNYMPWSV